MELRILIRFVWLAGAVLSLSRLVEIDHVARPGGKAAAEAGRYGAGTGRMVPEEVEAVPAERLQVYVARRQKSSGKGSDAEKFLDARMVKKRSTHA